MSAKPASAPRPAARAPSFRDLTRDECVALLRRNEIGRIAFSFESRVDLQPIHYVHEEGRLFGRTEAGHKLTTLRHSPWVAFEVDEIAGTFDWRSVVVHGTFYLLPEDGSPRERRARQHALELLARVVPGTGTAHDPVAFRDVVFEVAIDTLSGRQATTKPG